MATGGGRELPVRLVLQERDLLSRLLPEVRRWIVCYPGLAVGLINGLVAEGRAFAETPKGERTKAAFEQWDVVRRGRLLWDACGLDALLRDHPGPLPSHWLGQVLEGLAAVDLESLLSRWILEAVSDEDLDGP
jgi:hypothetical protein